MITAPQSLPPASPRTRRPSSASAASPSPPPLAERRPSRRRPRPALSGPWTDSSATPGPPASPGAAEDRGSLCLPSGSPAALAADSRESRSLLPSQRQRLIDRPLPPRAPTRAGGAHLRASPPPPLRSAPGGAALLIFTSGTTADPKACALSHAALSAASAAKLATVGYEASDTYLHAAPLFHVGGLSSAHAVLWVRMLRCGVTTPPFPRHAPQQSSNEPPTRRSPLTATQAGGSHVFLPKFTAAAAAEAIRRHGATALIAVPAMLADLAAGGEACPTVLRLLLGGGCASLPRPSSFPARSRILQHPDSTAPRPAEPSVAPPHRCADAPSFADCPSAAPPPRSSSPRPARSSRTPPSGQPTA